MHNNFHVIIIKITFAKIDLYKFIQIAMNNLYIMTPNTKKKNCYVLSWFLKILFIL